jgi:uncharacterized protein (TIGR00369 family)
MQEGLKPGREHYKDFIADIFGKAPFVQDLGIELVDVGPGWVESRLTVQSRHHQQNGMLHAGVATTIADHSAGAAAATLAPEGKSVLTVEFKVDLLRGGKGENLRCWSEVVKAGKTFSFCESRVHLDNGNQDKLVAKAAVTIAYVDVE